jgi:hypothetical protein
MDGGLMEMMGLRSDEPILQSKDRQALKHNMSSSSRIDPCEYV